MKAGTYSNTYIKRLIKLGYLKRIKYSHNSIEYDDVACRARHGIIINDSPRWYKEGDVRMIELRRDDTVFYAKLYIIVDELL